ncbi:MAG TPA: type III PLP-dependent enzyme [Candidatus Saccharimonadales bacterium]|nr:type III PLP-dependent enzyme [Candidatus Saccharimonadales bacterium]
MKYFDHDHWMSQIKDHYVAETPYMLTDLGIVRDHCQTFKTLLPDIKMYYAMKALPDKQVLQTINEVTEGFDAASIGEINELLSLKVPAHKITYSNPVKSIESIHEAALRGIKMFAVQSREEIDKIATLHKNLEIFVRVKMEDTHSAVPLSTKFGCSHDEAVEILQYAGNQGLTPAGITFHVGSQQEGLAEWSKAIHKSQELLRQANARGIAAKTINMGGGFPAHYHADDTTIEEVAREVNAAISAEKSFIYMAEPGRYIVAESSVIVATIIGVEERQHKPWLFLDVGVFQAFSGAQRFEVFPHTPFYVDLPHSHPSTEEHKNYVLTGPSCDSKDILSYDASLPAGLQVGDRIAFANTGAYTVVYGANFNGFKVPPRFFIDSSKNKEGRE